MYKNVYISRWNEYSRGAKGLSVGLGIRLIRNTKSTLKVTPDMVFINWGNGQMNTQLAYAEKYNCKVFNPPEAIHAVSNKRTFFETMKGLKAPPRVPEWTTNPLTALEWHKAGEEVCARTVLQGHSGDGLLFFSDNKDKLEPLLEASLFTKYVKKMEEYRVHIMNGEIIDVQKKLLRRTDLAGNAIDPKFVDFRIRNLANGFVYGGRDGDVPEDVEVQALLAMAGTKLDFGAVDVIYNNKAKKGYVLEINTAPGIVGTTLDNYVSAFTKALTARGIHPSRGKLEKVAI